MRTRIVLTSLSLMVSLWAWAAPPRASQGLRRAAWLTPARAWNAGSPAPQAKQPQWSGGREEYDAHEAMKAEKDPNKKIALADAYLAKYPKTDFKADAYVAKMTAYFQLSQPDKAVEAARGALQADPDNLDALVLLGYVFPFTFKGDDPEAMTKLSRADSDARHGLEVLQKLQKPANVTDEQFNQFVKPKRAIFNDCVGFVALQRKDYASAIAPFKAAAEDNPSDVYASYWLGLAYLYSSPSDYDHGIWYIARGVSLANASKNPAGADFEKFLKRAYVNYHGNEQGLSDILTQVAASPNPPDGFKVAPMETPKKTGDPNIDAFNDMTFPLKLGGEKAQKTWDALKGQALELGGAVDSVEKGTEPGSYLVRIDILEASKAGEGAYDVELKDSAQPNVKNLVKGDLLRFKGTIDSYTASPSLVLTIVGEVITDLPEKAPTKEKAKTKAKAKTTKKAVHRKTTR